jgi:hypothetical protein
MWREFPPGLPWKLWTASMLHTAVSAPPLPVTDVMGPDT